jgi:general secretion pathway protein B
MSLILEALKKSEQQRRLGEAPTFGSPVVATRRRRNVLPVLAILIALAAVAGWWLMRRSPTPAAPASTSTSTDAARSVANTPIKRDAPGAPSAANRTPDRAKQPGAPAASQRFEQEKRAAALGNTARTMPPTPAPVAMPPKSAGAATAPTATTAPTLPPAPTLADKSAGLHTAAAPPAPAPPVPAAQKPDATTPPAPAADKPVVATPAPPSKSPPAAVAALPTIWDLPFATRKDLPALDLSMHVYSADPKQRFVVLKGDRHVEGDEIADGLTLREIRQDGLVLEYKGQRFFFPRTGR